MGWTAKIDKMSDGRFSKKGRALKAPSRLFSAIEENVADEIVREKRIIPDFDEFDCLRELYSNVG